MENGESLKFLNFNTKNRGVNRNLKRRGYILWLLETPKMVVGNNDLKLMGKQQSNVRSSKR